MYYLMPLLKVGARREKLPLLPLPFHPQHGWLGWPGRQGHIRMAMTPHHPGIKLCVCCFDFLLKCVSTEVLPASLIGPAACPSSEPSERLCGTGGNFWQLATEATSVTLPRFWRTRQCQINTKCQACGFVLWVGFQAVIQCAVFFEVTWQMVLLKLFVQASCHFTYLLQTFQTRYVKLMLLGYVPSQLN